MRSQIACLWLLAGASLQTLREHGEHASPGGMEEAVEVLEELQKDKPALVDHFHSKHGSLAEGKVAEKSGSHAMSRVSQMSGQPGENRHIQKAREEMTKTASDVAKMSNKGYIGKRNRRRNHSKRPWSDTTTQRNFVMVNGFRDDMLLGGTKGITDMQALDREQKQNFAEQVPKMTNAIAATNTLSLGVQEDTDRIFTKVDEKLDALAPPIKTQQTTLKESLKTESDQYESSEKIFDDAAKEDLKKFWNKMKVRDKEQKLYFKHQDKKVTSDGKDFNKKVVTTNKALGKSFQKIYKQYEKDVKGFEKNTDDTKSALMDNVGGYTEAVANSDILAETLENGIIRLLESPDVTQMGLEPAIERASEMGNTFYDRSVDKIEMVEHGATIRLSNMDDLLSDKMKESGVQQATAIQAADTKLGNIAKEGEGLVDQFVDKTSDLGRTLGEKIREEARGKAMIDKEMAKAESGLNGATETAGRAVLKMKDTIHTKMDAYDKFTSEKLGETDKTQIAYVDTRENKLMKTMEMENSQINSDNAVMAKRIAQEFNSEVATSVSAANIERQKLSNIELTAQKVSSSLGTVSKGVQVLEDNVNGLPAIASKTKAAAEDAVNTVEQEIASAEDKTAANLVSANNFIQSQVADSQDLMGKSKVQYVDTLTQRTQSTTEAINELVAAARAHEHSVEGKARPVVTGLNEANKKIEDIRIAMKAAVEQGTAIKKTALNSLDAVVSDADNARSKAEGIAREKLAESQKHADVAIRHARESMDEKLAAQSERFKGGVEQQNYLFDQTKTHLSQRQRDQVGHMNNLGASLTAEQERIQRLSIEIPAAQENRMRSIATLENKINGIRQKASGDRMEFKDKFDEDLGAAHNKFLLDSKWATEDFEKNINSKVTAATAESLSERKGALEYLEDSSADVDRILEGSGKKLATVQNQEKEFAAFVASRDFSKSGSQAGSAQKKAESALQILTDSEMQRVKLHNELAHEAASVEQDIVAQAHGADADGAKSLLFVGEQVEGGLAKSRTDAEAGRTTLRSELGQADGRISNTVGSMQATELALRRQLAAGSAGVKRDLDAGQAIVYREAAVLQGDERKEMEQLAQQRMRDTADRQKSESDADGVDRDLQGQSNAIKGEVSRVNQAMGAAIHALDPSAHLQMSEKELQHLKDMEGKANVLIQRKVMELENSGASAVGGANKALEDAKDEEGALNGEIKEHAKKIFSEFSTVSGRTWDAERDSHAMVDEMTALISELTGDTHKRITGVNEDMAATKGDVDAAMELEKYQGEDAIKKVIAIVDGAQKTTDALEFQKTNVIQPDVAAWRKEIEQVFESMGMGLDMERIARLAAESMAREKEGGSILTAEQEMHLKIQQLTQELADKTQAIRDEASRMIAEIEAMSHLSREEKDRRIAAIKKKADEDAMALMKKYKALIAEQRSAGHSIDEDLRKLQGIMDRAKMLASSHDGSEASHKLVLQLQAELSRKMKEMRERWLSGVSLMQMNQLRHDQALAADPEAIKYRQEAATLAKWDAERKPEDQQLESQLALMEKSIPSLS